MFLNASPLTETSKKYPDVFKQALRELRAARSRGSLTAGRLGPEELAREAGVFARFNDPQALLDAEWKVINQVAEDLRELCPQLHRILVARTKSGTSPSLLAVAVRYYFRREVESDRELFQGLAFAKLDALQESQERGFTALTQMLSRQGDRLEGMLADLSGVVIEIAKTTQAIDKTTKETNQRIQVLEEQIRRLIEQLQMQNREVRPSDSFSVRNDGERQLVKQLVAQYRALPEEKRRQRPDLLTNVGKLEVVAGEFEAAQRDFQTVATMVTQPQAQAEAHHNAYRAALERKEWADALDALRQAVAIDPKRFAPFPTARYTPQQILGAGGFGVVFLCQHRHLGKPVVIKSLLSSELGRDITDVFAEARALEELNHPAIIRLRDCDYADEADTRPYLVMDYFEGVSLEHYVEEQGFLSPDDLLEITLPVAEALEAAHSRGILHRDVKPGNVLVRTDGVDWQVKLIDFGLALRPAALGEKVSSTGPQARTLVGRSIAGTMHYAAPEQMGNLDGVDPGTYSDVYGFGRTCYFALLGTPEPDDEEKESLPDVWRDLLSRCTRRKVTNRVQHFAEVLAALKRMRRQARPPAEMVADPPHPPAQTGGGVGKPTASRPAAVWVVRAGKQGEQEPIALDHNLVAIGWSDMPDLSGMTSRDELVQRYRLVYPDENRAAAIAAKAGQIWAFRSSIRAGDLVIIPLRTRSQQLAIGEVTGPYTYRTNLGASVRHTLPVRWLGTSVARKSLQQDLADTLGWQKTVYEIKGRNAEARFRAVLRGEVEPERKECDDSSEPDRLKPPAMAVETPSSATTSPTKETRLGGTSQDESESRLVKRFAKWPDRQWAESYLELVRELIQVSGLREEDPRLVMSVPRGKDLPITVNSRYVLGAFGPDEENPGHGVLGLILPASLDEVARRLPGLIRGVPFGPKYEGETDANTPLFVTLGVASPFDLDSALLSGWREAVQAECQHGQRSTFRKFHEPIVYRAATDLEYRKQLLDRAFGAAASAAREGGG